MTVNVELVGGPMDGQRLTWPESMMAHHAGLPGRVALCGDGMRVAISDDPAIDQGHGIYVQSRKITRDGRLVYEFRGSEAGR